MNWDRDSIVRPRSTAHFFVFIIGVSPTAFSSTSTIKVEKIKGESAAAAAATQTCLAESEDKLLWELMEKLNPLKHGEEIEKILQN